MYFWSFSVLFVNHGRNGFAKSTQGRAQPAALARQAGHRAAALKGVRNTEKVPFYLFILKYIGPTPVFIFSMHKQRISSQCYAKELVCFPLKPRTCPGGIRARVFCSWGGFDIPWATPPGQRFIFIRTALSHLFSSNTLLNKAFEDFKQQHNDLCM
jgi:hypothetical protein